MWLSEEPPAKTKEVIEGEHYMVLLKFMQYHILRYLVFLGCFCKSIKKVLILLRFLNT